MFEIPALSKLSTWPFELSGARGEESSADGSSRTPRIQQPSSKSAPRPKRLAVVSRPSQRTAVSLLLATASPPRPSTMRDGALFKSARGGDHNYVVKTIVIDSLEQLSDCCNSNAPAVLLVDLALIPNAEAVHHLQRRLPATEWLIVYDAPPAAGLDTTLLLLVRGCLRWSDSAEHVARALDAVAAGGSWFPRSMLESLYLTTLESLTSETPEPDSVFATPLTARETEVHDLMRQGMTNRQISHKLDISVNTVKKHLAHVFEKRGLRGRRQDYP
jgi:DNA-binding NarL/FixJ family response regulator